MSNVINLFHARRAKQDAEQDARTPAKEVGSQLSLQFSEQDTVVCVQSRDFTEADDFLYFAYSLGVQTLLDLRIAPRLNFVCPGRAQAFRLFDSLGITYRDVLGRLDIDSYELTAEGCGELVNQVEQVLPRHFSGSTVALFEDATFMLRVADLLRQKVEPLCLDTFEVRRIIAEGARAQM